MYVLKWRCLYFARNDELGGKNWNCQWVSISWEGSESHEESGKKSDRTNTNTRNKICDGKVRWIEQRVRNWVSFRGSFFARRNISSLKLLTLCYQTDSAFRALAISTCKYVSFEYVLFVCCVVVVASVLSSEFRNCTKFLCLKQLFRWHERSHFANAPANLSVHCDCICLFVCRVDMSVYFCVFKTWFTWWNPWIAIGCAWLSKLDADKCIEQKPRFPFRLE